MNYMIKHVKGLVVLVVLLSVTVLLWGQGGVTAVLSIAQTWTALQTFSGGAVIANVPTVAGSITSGNLACYTASNTVGNCIGTPSNNIIGVFNSSSTWVSTGETTVTLDATVNVTFGDILCASSSVGVSHDNGTISCATGEGIGVVKTTATGVSSAAAFLRLY